MTSLNSSISDSTLETSDDVRIVSSAPSDQTPVKDQKPTTPNADIVTTRGEQSPNDYTNFVHLMRNRQANSTSVCTYNISSSRVRRSVTINDHSVSASSSGRVAKKQTPYYRNNRRSCSFIRRPKVVDHLNLPHIFTSSLKTNFRNMNTTFSGHPKTSRPSKAPSKNLSPTVPLRNSFQSHRRRK